MILYDTIKPFRAGSQIAVAIVGDSVGAGYYCDRSDLLPSGKDNPLVRSYANQLREHLQLNNPQNIVYNYSTSGYSTTQHLGTVDTLAGLTPKPTLAFIALGINDHSGVNQILFSTYQSQLRSIVQDAIDNGMTPVLIKENFIDPARETIRTVGDGKEYIDFINEQDQIAAEYSCAVVDFYTPTAGDNWSIYKNPDETPTHSTHPNQDGHDLLYGIMSDFWDNLLNITVNDSIGVPGIIGIDDSNEIRLNNWLGLDAKDISQDEFGALRIKSSIGTKSINYV